jgi:hypothetical protein
MNNVSKRLGAFVATAAALPSLLTANPGAALAEDCKQAPAPPSSRAYITNVSKQPVLIAYAGPSVAQAQEPNCPPRDGVDVFLDSQRRLRNGLIKEAERFRDLPPVPGS